MTEIIKYGKKWNKDPNIQENIIIESEKIDFKIESIEIRNKL